MGQVLLVPLPRPGAGAVLHAEPWKHGLFLQVTLEILPSYHSIRYQSLSETLVL